MPAKIAAVLRINCKPEDAKGLLLEFSDFFVKRLDVDVKDVIVELHTSVPIMRGGSTDRAMNVDIHHNMDAVNRSSKVQIAEDVADKAFRLLGISKNRTLVLFFDTRKCS